MRKNNCEMIRQELDELMLDETCSAAAVAHLKECVACREFQETQTKLRRMVGSLGTVAAPADFDFRLRARLANAPANGAINYWPMLHRGLAVVAVVIVFAFGVVVVRNLYQTPPEDLAVKQPPAQPAAPARVEVIPMAPAPSEEHKAKINRSGAEEIRNERSAQSTQKIKRPLSAIDFSKQGAEVISGSEAYAMEAGTVFPIDASAQPFRLSLDDGQGNARTISVPTIRFGSQRMLPGKNQYAEKGIW